MKPDGAPQWAMRVRNEALEEAAKIAEGIGIPRVASGDRNLMVPVEIAQAIRSLKTRAS